MILSRITIPSPCRVGDTINHLLMGDLHCGSEDTAEDKIKEDLEEGRKNKAHICINGDWGEWIWKADPRHTPSNDKFAAQDDYQKSLLDRTEKILAPYANMIEVIGGGNHEFEFQKRHGIDVTSALIERLQKHRKNKPYIKHGGYSGFIVIEYQRKTEKNNVGSLFYTIYYNHGQGGTSEVTLGTIDLQRYMTKVQSDLVWLAHKHQKVLAPSMNVIYVNRRSVGLGISEQTRCGVITGGYKANINISTTPNYQERKTRSNAGYGGIILQHGFCHHPNQKITTKIIMNI